MKRFILLFHAIFIILSFLFALEQVNLQQFNNNIRKRIIVDLDLGEYFYKGNEQYFESIEDFFNFGKYDSIDIDFLKRQMFDPFLSNNQILKYIPIYDRTSTYPVACIFLSVGEDGVFNNNITQKLYMDDWYKVIKAYNLDEVKQEIEKFTIKYPIFNRNIRKHGWYILNVDESTLRDKKILLKGDSLFRGNFDINAMDAFSNPRRPFIYKKYSILKKKIGGKDYIVNWGCRVIEYKIEN